MTWCEVALDTARKELSSNPAVAQGLLQTTLAPYLAATYGDVDDSRCLVWRDGPNIQGVLAYTLSSGQIGFFDREAFLAIDSGLSFEERQDVESELVGIVGSEFAQAKNVTLSVLSAPSSIGVFESLLLTKATSLTPVPIGWVDLRLKQQNPSLGLRRRYKSYLNKSERFLRVANIDEPSDFEAHMLMMRRFHAEVAGRETRSDESWHEMLLALARGNAQLTFAWAENHVWAVVYSWIAAGTSLYMTGIFRREPFPVPVSIRPFQFALMGLAERGLNTFQVGPVWLQKEHYSDKERSIAHWRRGFSSSVRVDRIWGG